MNKKYMVRLTDDERAACEATIKKETGKSQRLRRAAILLKADADGPAWDDARISEAALDNEGKASAPGSAIIKLPDDLWGTDSADLPNAGRVYDADGAFELEQQSALSGLFTGLNDGEQHP